ncbi:uncharacterized protein Dwil_GK16971 [Drosophila willistoni]|uniref:Cytochrome b5 heme-binding domain-containing protein n=1 Tax=Drosophila willistoni TaxID=7260 RepID=B4MLH2_DROWI|nr:membrane-associated progesterone receptor component 1 [Drosophila willistoni]EDW72828.1 uncharacterized protein Dwil_GK16971 [Drosophila willistoni]
MAVGDILNEILTSPMNIGLLAVIFYLIYKIIRDRNDGGRGPQKPAEPELPKLKRDFTIEELKEFDGNQPDGRVLVGVNGSVYDMTKGKRFYGPGGPYASFAGRDASRNLATFNTEPNDKTEYDDLSDLTPAEMDSVLEWESQFKVKYDYVGKLLRPGEKHTNYDEELETQKDEPETKKEN